MSIPVKQNSVCNNAVYFTYKLQFSFRTLQILQCFFQEAAPCNSWSSPLKDAGLAFSGDVLYHLRKIGWKRFKMKGSSTQTDIVFYWFLCSQAHGLHKTLHNTIFYAHVSVKNASAPRLKITFLICQFQQCPGNMIFDQLGQVPLLKACDKELCFELLKQVLSSITGLKHVVWLESWWVKTSNMSWL